MILYIIKSMAIMAIILGVYSIFMEKEKMHRFNRFYLLSGLALALCTPLITVGSIDAPEYLSTLELAPSVIQGGTINTSEYIRSTITWQAGLLIGYLLVAFIFFLRFTTNLFSILNKAYCNQKIYFKGFQLVLLKEPILPHTFLHYVFINKDQYHSDRIEDQLFTHELTHAHQMHSLDVVLIELIQIIFWFNPLIYLYKRAIQLNHEFLADEQVINSHGQITEYQHLLVDKAGDTSSTLSKFDPQIQLASNFNFAVTKKRLKMMTKSSTRWRTSLYAASTIPLFVCLLMLFGNQAIAQTTEMEKEKHETIKDAHFKNATFVWKEKNGSRVYKNYSSLSEEQKAQIPMPPPPPPAPGQQSKASPVMEPLPVGAVVVYDVRKNSLSVSSDGNGILPPPPPNAPKAPTAVAPPPPPAAPMAPPPPPAPPSPLDAAVDIAKSGGTFSLNGQMVNSDAAIAALKNEDQVKEVFVKKQSNGKRLMIITTKK